MKVLLGVSLVLIFASTAAAQGRSGRYGVRSPWDRAPESHEYQPEVEYDEYGRVIVRTGRDNIHDSAHDPDRDVVDPGSYKYVNRKYRDRYGRLVHQYGPKWTSYGVPHSEITTRVISGSGGGGGGGGAIFDDSSTDIRSSRPSGGRVIHDDSQTDVYSSRPSSVHEDSTTEYRMAPKRSGGSSSSTIRRPSTRTYSKPRSVPSR